MPLASLSLELSADIRCADSCGDKSCCKLDGGGIDVGRPDESNRVVPQPDPKRREFWEIRKDFEFRTFLVNFCYSCNFFC